MMKHFRGIAVLDVGMKINTGVLIRLARTLARLPPSWRQVCTFAYEPKRSVSEVLLLIITLLSRAHEWRGKLEINIFIADILGAFDHTSLPLFACAGAARNTKQNLGRAAERIQAFDARGTL